MLMIEKQNRYLSPSYITLGYLLKPMLATMLAASPATKVETDVTMDYDKTGAIFHPCFSSGF